MVICIVEGNGEKKRKIYQFRRSKQFKQKHPEFKGKENHFTTAMMQLTEKKR